MPKPTNVMGLLRAGQQAKSLAALGSPEERLAKLRLDAIAAAESMMRLATATGNPAQFTAAIAAAQKASEFFESSKQPNAAPPTFVIEYADAAELDPLEVRAESPEARLEVDAGSGLDD